MPTYLITGTSGGIGLGLVQALAARGDKVFATCRKKASTATGEDLISAVSGDVTILEDIDVTADECGAKLSAALLAGGGRPLARLPPRGAGAEPEPEPLDPRPRLLSSKLFPATSVEIGQS